jgi:hypothetical protein
MAPHCPGLFYALEKIVLYCSWFNSGLLWYMITLNEDLIP